MKRNQILILAALLWPLSPPVLADDHTFSKPQSNGYRVDFCRNWGEGCGEVAANAFCLTQGYEAATAFAADNDIGASTPTQTLGDHKVCDQAFCDGFLSISCYRAGSTAPASRTSGTASRGANPAVSSTMRINPALIKALKKPTQSSAPSSETTQPPMPAQPEPPKSTTPGNPPPQPTAPEVPPPASPKIPPTQPGGDPDEFLVIYPSSTQARMGIFGNQAAAGKLEELRTVPLVVKSDLLAVEPGDFNGDGQTDLALLEYPDPSDLGSVDITLLSFAGTAGFQPLAHQALQLSGMPLLTVGKLLEKGHDDALLYVPAGGSAVIFSAQYGLVIVQWGAKGALIPIDANGDGIEETLDYADPAGTLDLVGLELIEPDANDISYATPVIRPLPPVGELRRFTVGDFTGDGRDDLFIFDPTAGEMSLAQFNTKGGISSNVMISSGWPETYLVTNGYDFIGDQRDEELAYNPTEGEVILVRFTEAGKVQGFPNFSTMKKATGLIPGFFTGSGKASVIGMQPLENNRLFHVQFDEAGQDHANTLMEQLPDGGIIVVGNFVKGN